MQMNVTGRLRPWSEQGKINSTAESLKNPDLIVRAFGLIRPGEREVFCSVVSVCRLQGMAGYEARACLTCKSPHTALTLWLLMGGLLWLQRLPRRSPQACQRLSVSLWRLAAPEGAVGRGEVMRPPWDVLRFEQLRTPVKESQRVAHSPSHLFTGRSWVLTTQEATSTKSRVKKWF